MILGVTGSRQRNSEENYVQFCNALRELLKENNDLLDYVVTGGCVQGADNFALRAAKKYGIPIKIYFPALPLAGSAKYLFVQAYHARNEQIANEATHMIAMPQNKNDWLGGTGHTMNCFIKYHEEGNLIIV